MFRCYDLVFSDYYQTLRSLRVLYSFFRVVVRQYAPFMPSALGTPLRIIAIDVTLLLPPFHMRIKIYALIILMVDLTTRTLRFYNYATLFVFRYYAPRIYSLSFFARIVFKSLSSTKSILFYGSGYAFKLFPRLTPLI